MPMMAMIIVPAFRLQQQQQDLTWKNAIAALFSNKLMFYNLSLKKGLFDCGCEMFLTLIFPVLSEKFA